MKLFPAVSACALASASLMLAVASDAEAAACASLPNPVYVLGSSAVKPFLASVAKNLAGQAEPITVVYLGKGSCDGVQALASATPGTISSVATVWDASTGAEVSGGCTPSLAGDPVDIGVSDVWAESCAVSLPGNVKDFHGPIQAMTFAVPAQSTQTSISAEAAYLLTGWGDAGDVSPWLDTTLVQIRSATSGTQQMIAAAIGVPATKWKGTSNSGSGAVLTNLASAATTGNADKAIGILASDLLKDRSVVRPLAYQHYEQECGYWPDSSPDSFDKKNVRDGHYMIWGPLHILARVENGVVNNAKVKRVIDALSLADESTAADMIDLEAKNGVVPECAMRVTRTSEAGALASFMPEKSCECRFIKSATGTAPSSCKPCTGPSECDSSASACNFGFCEVR